MEAEMLQEMERRKQEQLEEAKRREVRFIFLLLALTGSAAVSSWRQLLSRQRSSWIRIVLKSHLIEHS
jgi:hypothetical protein